MARPTRPGNDAVSSVPGVLLGMFGAGVLLTGPSGIGKSHLALELIDRGHRLVADDAPELRRAPDGGLVGSGPARFAPFLEVRGVGVVEVRRLFGAASVSARATLVLVIRLLPADDLLFTRADRLRPYMGTRRYLDLEVPELSLPVTSAGVSAVVVETAVRNHILGRQGFDAAGEFVRLQRALLDDQRDTSG